MVEIVMKILCTHVFQSFYVLKKCNYGNLWETIITADLCTVDTVFLIHTAINIDVNIDLNPF